MTSILHWHWLHRDIVVPEDTSVDRQPELDKAVAALQEARQLNGKAVALAKHNERIRMKNNLAPEIAKAIGASRR